MLEAVPELADGGFWYHVELVEFIHPARGPMKRANISQGVRYMGRPFEEDGTIVIRCPDPIIGVGTVDGSPGRKLAQTGHTSRPKFRNRGQ